MYWVQRVLWNVVDLDANRCWRCDRWRLVRWLVSDARGRFSWSSKSQRWSKNVGIPTKVCWALVEAIDGEPVDPSKFIVVHYNNTLDGQHWALSFHIMDLIHVGTWTDRYETLNVSSTIVSSSAHPSDALASTDDHGISRLHQSKSQSHQTLSLLSLSWFHK